MKKILFTLLALTSLLFSAEHKVVFDLTSSDFTKIEKSLIGNINLLKAHYLENGDTFKVAVVISGGAYRYFIENIDASVYKEDTQLKNIQKVLREKLEGLASTGVKFEVCSVGMKKRNIKQENMYRFVIPAFNKTDALIRWQNRGYAYIPIL